MGKKKHEPTIYYSQQMDFIFKRREKMHFILKGTGSLKVTG